MIPAETAACAAFTTLLGRGFAPHPEAAPWDCSLSAETGSFAEGVHFDQHLATSANDCWPERSSAQAQMRDAGRRRVPQAGHVRAPIHRRRSWVRSRPRRSTGSVSQVPRQVRAPNLPRARCSAPRRCGSDAQSSCRPNSRMSHQARLKEGFATNNLAPIAARTPPQPTCPQTAMASARAFVPLTLGPSVARCTEPRGTAAPVKSPRGGSSAARPARCSSARLAKTA